MNLPLLLLAAKTSIWTRLAGFAVALIIGAALSVTGFYNFKTKKAEETGSRRLVNQALGRSNTYEGSVAEIIGVLKIIFGLGAFAFGIYFLIYGPMK